MKKFYQQIPSFGGLLFSYVFTMALFSTLFVISLIELKRIDQVVIGACVSGFALFFFTHNLWLLVKAPGVIQIDSVDIWANFYHNRVVKIRFTDITRIAGHLGVSSVIKINYQLAKTRNSFLIHVDKLRNGEKFEVGELMEHILQYATNIQQIEIEKFTDQVFRHQLAWGKKPDWAIITGAKNRAKENREKSKN